MEKKNDLQTLLEINAADTANGTQNLIMGLDCVETKKVRAGTVVSMGIGGDMVAAIALEKVMPVLFLVNRAEFNKVSAIPVKRTYSDEEVEAWKKKAEKWDKLDEKISKYYVDDKGEPLDDDDGGDLGNIGEAAAIAFGYL